MQRGNQEQPDGRRSPANQVVLRYVVGLAWSLGVGLSGAWLMLAPWAVGGQGAGAWTSATAAQLWTGVALVALGILGAALVGLDVRAAIADTRPPTAPPAPAGGDEIERTLIELARRLTVGLEQDRPGLPAAAGTAAPDGPGRRTEP